MIRHRSGDWYLLVTQHDHAGLSGQFARLIGNGFTPLAPEVIDGISLHDAGWPLHDDRPTLNARGEPIDVLESSMPLATRVWSESVRRAAAHHPYSGLLVSLHVMALSMIAQKHDGPPHERARDASDVFLLNKFHHQQIEQQESLRRQVGLATDQPLRQGLAPLGTSDAEDLLRFNFGLLRATDALSLDVCSSRELFKKIDGVHRHPGATPVELTVGHPAPARLTVDPWPFVVRPVTLNVPCRRVAARLYASDEDLWAEYDAAPCEVLDVELAPA